MRGAGIAIAVVHLAGCHDAFDLVTVGACGGDPAQTMHDEDGDLVSDGCDVCADGGANIRVEVENSPLSIDEDEVGIFTIGTTARFHSVTVIVSD